MTSTVCAIVPTYNRSAMLRECLDSLLSQTRPLDEIIVVNDGSTDDTEAVVKNYGDRVHLIAKTNGGKSSALNLGIAKCTSDYVWICDDDDIAAPDGLAHMVAALDANDDAGLVFGTYQIFRDTEKGRVFVEPAYWARHNETGMKIIFFEQMITCQFATLVRRALYQQVGPFREDLIRSQDYEMMLRLILASKAVQLRNVIFFQRAHAGLRGSATDSFAAEKSARKWLAYDQKIFSDIRKKCPLDDFTPSFASAWTGKKRERAALIERGCVLATRGLWELAIPDFNESSRILTTGLLAEEVHIAETVIVSGLAWDDLYKNHAWVQALCDVYYSNQCGRDIVLSICRPLIWLAKQRFRDGDYVHGARLLILMQRILGLEGAFLRFFRSLRT